MVGSVPAGLVSFSAPRTPRGEPLSLALERLAAKAHAEGLVILDDGFAPFACRVTSSRPGEAPYLVHIVPGPGHGCDCPGYQKFSYCKHFALALEAAGWLPEVELIAEATDGAAETPLPSPIAHHLSPAQRRAHAAADLAARYPSQHPARPEDVEAA